MAYEIGYTDNSTKLAHYAFLDKIHDLAVANGWTVLRRTTAAPNPELIISGPGTTDYQDVYVGFRAYQDAGADYYNIAVAGFTGYLSAETFANQPGARVSGVPMHNNRIDYWLTVNNIRIAFGAKVGTPVYESAYVGLALPYATPGQFPYPMVVGGALTGEAATRFSETTHDMPYRGSNARMAMRWVDGTWQTPETWPWNNVYFTTTNQVRDTGSKYALYPVILTNSTSGVFGELDGVFFITGFNNAVENTLVIGGVTYVVLQAVYRTGFADYYALRMS